ncbi:hypothetical protein CEXT_32361 [Caerostris extrusa]|uniref:Uncharacterized protein n=1 Tax=Caerostris extrusa TaxID=172846 RepID=A0AAV4RSC8_CAEEX|nr:hypothetical protein CEXT_32361 [Caerostris extrusa]
MNVKAISLLGCKKNAIEPNFPCGLLKGGLCSWDAMTVSKLSQGDLYAGGSNRQLTLFGWNMQHVFSDIAVNALLNSQRQISHGTERNIKTMNRATSVVRRKKDSIRIGVIDIKHAWYGRDTKNSINDLLRICD